MAVGLPPNHPKLDNSFSIETSIVLGNPSFLLPWPWHHWDWPRHSPPHRGPAVSEARGSAHGSGGIGWEGLEHVETKVCSLW
jgi:hypothetical protein